MIGKLTNKVRMAFASSGALSVVVLLALAAVGAGPAEAAFPSENGKIAFSSDRTTGSGVNNPEGDYEIFTMNRDGTGLTQLTDNTANDTSPSWSADGSVVVFTSNRDGNYEIYVMDALDGSSQTRLTKNAALDSLPAWSPDGKKIAFSRYQDFNSDILVVNANTKKQKRLTTNPAIDYLPDWQSLVN